MTGVVLAVAKRALAVLPRLAPDDRRQRRPGNPWRRGGERLGRRPRIQHASLFERMLARRVVADATVADDPGLGRMQVAARRIDAQRPARLAGIASRPRAPSSSEGTRRSTCSVIGAGGASRASKSAAYGTSPASGACASSSQRRAVIAPETDWAASPSRDSRATAQSG